MDTNFLIMPERFGVDIFAEIREKFPDAEFATVGQVVTELKKMKKKFALGMIKEFKMKIVKETGDTDTALLNAAARESGAVCTNDLELKKRCIGKKVPVVFMRNKKTVEMKGGINV